MLKLDNTLCFFTALFIFSNSVLSMHLEEFQENAKNKVRAYLRDCRSNGTLKTVQEFEAFISDNNIEFIKKGCVGAPQHDIGRFIRANDINNAIKILGLTKIKVPLKIACFKENINESIKLKVGKLLSTDDIAVYAQKISEVDRRVSLEELKELARLLKTIGFCDINLGNFMVSSDCIYVIDTEYRSFTKVNNDLDTLKLLLMNNGERMARAATAFDTTGLPEGLINRMNLFKQMVEIFMRELEESFIKYGEFIATTDSDLIKTPLNQFVESISQSSEFEFDILLNEIL